MLLMMGEQHASSLRCQLIALLCRYDLDFWMHLGDYYVRILATLQLSGLRSPELI